MTYCVVIPTYKEYNQLNNFELLGLDSIHKNFPKNLIYLIAPEGLNIDGYQIFNVKFFKKDFFSSLKGYNMMCTNYHFYESFKDFDYMLIHQLDAYTIENKIEYFMNLGYDWYGAPWKFLNGYSNICGNGGYSLRKISKMIEVCKKTGTTDFPEDNFFAAYIETYLIYALLK